MLAWHFLSGDKRLGYGDGRLVEVGQTLECEGDLALCYNGMHGSVRLIDALYYASEPIICRVEIEGDIIEDEDKLCGRRRTVLWWLDATRILHEFACQCAEDALALVDAPDFRSVAAIDAKRRWLNGEITDEELYAARADAWAAADAAYAAADAAWVASASASAAAWAAAWYASEAARSAAVRYAWSASSAARDAASAAAWAAAWYASEAARSAAVRYAWSALSAARDAARAAASEKQDARLTDMVMAAHEANEMVQEDE